MSNIATIETAEGVVKIDEQLFKSYIREAFEHLGAIEQADSLFKEVVETVSETTGIKKSKVSKYFKERFAAKTKATKELGVLFEKLDEVVEG
jgi:predicted solute-binding protein